jgi:hypothetical protein
VPLEKEEAEEDFMEELGDDKLLVFLARFVSEDFDIEEVGLSEPTTMSAPVLDRLSTAETSDPVVSSSHKRLLLRFAVTKFAVISISSSVGGPWRLLFVVCLVFVCWVEFLLSLFVFCFLVLVRGVQDQ